MYRERRLIWVPTAVTVGTYGSTGRYRRIVSRQVTQRLRDLEGGSGRKHHCGTVRGWMDD